MLYWKKIFIRLLLAVLLVAPAVNAQDVVLIANPDVPDASLSASDVQNIYLGNKTSWENGSRIHFITMNEAGTHEAFLRAYVGRTPSQFQTFWRQQVFTGRGRMPPSVANDQAMVNMVTSTSGAIGYVSAGADRGNVKTLSIQ